MLNVDGRIHGPSCSIAVRKGRGRDTMQPFITLVPTGVWLRIRTATTVMGVRPVVLEAAVLWVEMTLVVVPLQE